MIKTSSLKTRFVGFAFVMTSLLTSAQAGIVFTGSGASPALVGDSQTVSGVTDVEGELNFITGTPVAWDYITGLHTIQGGWNGASIWGSDIFSDDDDYFEDNYSLGTSGLSGEHLTLVSRGYYSLDSHGVTIGQTNPQDPTYAIGAHGNLSVSYGKKEFYSGTYYQDAISYSGLQSTGTYPGIVNYVEATVDGSGGSLSFRDTYFTWYRTATLPTGLFKRDRLNRLSTIVSRSTLAMSFGGSNNILKLNHPTDTNNMGIELNPSAGTVKVNNVPLLTQAAADSRYMSSSSTDGVVFGGTFGQGTIPAEGAGERMMWYSGKAAFRVGKVAGSYNGNGIWDDVNIGNYSFAAGVNSVASGNYSFATGTESSATASGSVAMGSGSSATASYSVAMGMGSYAGGDGSTALGSSGAYGHYSLAMGSSVAEGDYSAALGMGYAVGNCSTALGGGWADADLSTAFGGFDITATSFGSTVIGLANVPDWTQSATIWQAADELFVVGNGSGTLEGAWTPSNALVMRKNANMRTGGIIEAKGVIRCAPGGDLSMGTFTAGQNPATLDVALKYSDE